MNEEEFWDRFYNEFFTGPDNEYMIMFDVCFPVLIISEEWWEEVEDCIAVKTLNYIIIPLVEEDEAIFKHA